MNDAAISALWDSSSSIYVQMQFEPQEPCVLLTQWVHADYKPRAPLALKGVKREA